MAQKLNTRSCSSEQTQTMVNLYLSGMSCAEAAKQAGFKSHKTCVAALKRMGVPLQDRSGKNRKHFFKQDFFHEINTESQAYWLGFCAADGSIDKYNLSFHLSIKDSGHLAKFAQDIELQQDVKILTRNGRMFETLVVSSKKLIRDLSNYSIVEHKSHIVQPPLISSNLEQHYWRGIFDGDGSIAFHKDKNRSITLVGNMFMLDGFCHFIQKHLGYKYCARPMGKIYQIVISGRYKIGKILDLLYSNSCVYLTRKHNLANKLWEENQCLDSNWKLN